MTMRPYLLLSFLVLAGAARAENCTLELVADDAMKFDKATATVSSSCASIEIKLTHAGKLPAAAMGHNVVISPADTYQAAAQDGMKAGAAADYVTPGDARVIAHTKVIGGGESTSASFPGNKLAKGGNYVFYCSFPGHWAVMKGTLVVE